MAKENNQKVSSLAIIQAWDYIHDGQPGQAIKILNTELPKVPDNRLILYSLGLSYRMLNNYNEAEKFYLRALASGNRDIIAFPNLKGYDCLTALDEGIYCQLGILYQLKDDYEKAVGAFKKAIELRKTYGNAYNSLGITYRKMGKWEEALEIYNRGREALVNFATEEAFKEKDKNFRDVSSEGEKILEIQPYFTQKIRELLRSNLDYSLLCCNMARVYVEIGKIEEAKKLLKESIEFIPEGDDFNDPYLALKDLTEKKE